MFGVIGLGIFAFLRCGIRATEDHYKADLTSTSSFKTTNPPSGSIYSWLLTVLIIYHMVWDLTRGKSIMLRSVRDPNQLAPTAPLTCHPTELTRYMPRKKIVREKNLLSSDENDILEPEEEIDVSKCSRHPLFPSSCTHPGQEYPMDSLLVTIHRPRTTHNDSN